MNVTIYTDGSCLNNGQPGATGGWAVVISGDTELTLSGKLPGEKQTNNRAELYALQMALEWLLTQNDIKASIKSDSKIMIDGLTGSAQRKANRDIWLEVEKLCSKLNGRITSVSHVGREDNKIADDLAKKAANALICF